MNPYSEQVERLRDISVKVMYDLNINPFSTIKSTDEYGNDIWIENWRKWATDAVRLPHLMRIMAG